MDDETAQKLPPDKWIKAECKKIDDLNADEERRRIQEAFILTEYYRDRPWYWIGQGGRIWEIEPDLRTDLKWDNRIAPIVHTNTTNFVSAKLKLNCEPRTDYPSKRGGSNIADAILEYYEPLHWNEYSQQQMAQDGQLKRNYFIYTKLDPKAGAQEKIPEVQSQQTQSDGRFTCTKCGAAGSSSEMQTEGECPYCGGPAPTISAPKPVEGLSISYKQTQSGEPTCEVVPATEIKVDPKAVGGQLKLAQWLRRETIDDREALKKLYKNAKLDETISEALGTEQSLKNYSKQKDGEGKAKEGKCPRKHYWLTVEKVENYVASEEYSVGKFAIKEGQGFTQAQYRGGQFCGLLVIMNGDEILDIDTECLQDHWLCGQWRSDASGVWGKGLNDLTPLQDAWNDRLQAEHDQLEFNSAPYTVVSKQVDHDFSGEMGKVYHVQLTGDTDSVDRHIKEGQARPLQQDFYASKEWLNKRFDSYAPPALVGTPDPSNPTMGGKVLERNTAVGQHQPAIDIKREVKKEWGRQVLKLIQKYKSPQWYASLAGEFGQIEIQWFRESDIDRDLILHVDEGSSVPKTPIERIFDRKSYIELRLQDANGIIQPELWTDFENLLGIDIESDPNLEDKRVAEIRFEKVKDLAAEMKELPPEMLTPMLTPEEQQQAMMTGAPPKPMSPACRMILSQVQIWPEADNHLVHIATWQKQLKAGADDEPNPVLVEVCQMMIRMHKDVMAGVTQQDNTLMAQAQAPLNPQEPPDTSKQDMAGEKVKADSEGKQAQLADKQSERESKISEAAKDRKHEKAMATGAQAHELKKIKAQPRARA